MPTKKTQKTLLERIKNTLQDNIMLASIILLFIAVVAVLSLISEPASELVSDMTSSSESGE